MENNFVEGFVENDKSAAVLLRDLRPYRGALLVRPAEVNDTHLRWALEQWAVLSGNSATAVLSTATNRIGSQLDSACWTAANRLKILGIPFRSVPTDRTKWSSVGLESSPERIRSIMPEEEKTPKSRREHYACGLPAAKSPAAYQEASEIPKNEWFQKQLQDTASAAEARQGISRFTLTQLLDLLCPLGRSGEEGISHHHLIGAVVGEVLYLCSSGTNCTHDDAEPQENPTVLATMKRQSLKLAAEGSFLAPSVKDVIFDPTRFYQVVLEMQRVTKAQEKTIFESSVATPNLEPTTPRDRFALAELSRFLQLDAEARLGFELPPLEAERQMTESQRELQRLKERSQRAGCLVDRFKRLNEAGFVTEDMLDQVPCLTEEQRALSAMERLHALQEAHEELWIRQLLVQVSGYLRDRALFFGEMIATCDYHQAHDTFSGVLLDHLKRVDSLLDAVGDRIEELVDEVWLSVTSPLREIKRIEYVLSPTLRVPASKPVSGAEANEFEAANDDSPPLIWEGDILLFLYLRQLSYNIVHDPSGSHGDIASAPLDVGSAIFASQQPTNLVSTLFFHGGVAVPFSTTSLLDRQKGLSHLASCKPYEAIPRLPPGSIDPPELWQSWASTAVQLPTPPLAMTFAPSAGSVDDCKRSWQLSVNKLQRNISWVRGGVAPSLADTV